MKNFKKDGFTGEKNYVNTNNLSFIYIGAERAAMAF
jgi:hypothetical protein